MVNMKNNEYDTGSKSEEEKIYNALIKCIDNVLKEQGGKYFTDEGDFHLRLYMELKKHLKGIDSSIQIILEYNCLNCDIEKENAVKNNETIRKSFEIDIAVLVNNSHYLIELKYSAYNGNVYTNGTRKEDILNSDKKKGLYESDIEKIRDLINKNDCIKGGYCVLLTTSNIDKDCYSYCIKDLRVEHHNTIGIYTYYIKKINNPALKGRGMLFS
jgi:hypothetical protein